MATPKQIYQSTGYGVDRGAGVDNPFAGTDYADMWENNPYRYLYYDPSFWDNIGLSNKAKDANSEYQRLYDEYVAGIYEQQRQDTYNSESAQVARQRQAGLNPDLLGVENSQTGQMTPPNAGMNPALNGRSPALDAFGTITQVLGFATSSLKAINEIKGLSIANSAGEASNFNTYLEQARPHIVAEYARRFLGQTENNWVDVMNVSNPYESRKQSRGYKKAFQSVLSSSQFTSSESAYKQLTADDRAMKHFIGGIVDLELNYLKADYKGKTREANTKGFLDNWRNQFYESLYQDWKNGSDLAGLILIGSANKFNTLGIGLKNNTTTKWHRSGIKWNDSVLTGIGKKFGLW